MGIKKIFFVLLPMLWCGYGVAHTGNLKNSDQAWFKNEVNLNWSLLSGVRSETGLEDRLFTIPGNLMGGDPATPTRGFALDEALLMLRYRKESGAHFEVEAALHGHGGRETSLELEQAYGGMTKQIKDDLYVILQTGKMKGAFSPEIGKHAANHYFYLQPLPYIAFFGGHYVDNGIRLEILKSSSGVLGAEYWQGQSFPAGATDETYAWDVFGYKAFGENQQIKLGCWVHFAKADQRIDERLDSGHQHNNQATNTAIVQFSGDQQVAGVHGSWGWTGLKGIQGRIVGEWMSVEQDGDLSDASRLSSITGKHKGAWLQSEIQLGKQTWSLHYSELILKNHLIGAGSAILIEEAGLSAPDSNPTSQGVSVQKPILSSLNLRLEWQKLDTKNAEDYWGVSVLWRESLKYSF